MAKPDDTARSGDQPFDRFMRFGTARFAVKKEELPKRDERAERKPRKKPKPEGGA
jgi:hypothetical protein